VTEPRHEWDSSYQGDDPAPWDIGRPQPAFVALAEQGRLAGDVLDAGCGTGEHALLAAAHGARATGVDLSGAAIVMATEKAASRQLVAEFEAGDILTMPLPQAGFDVAVDSGLFHTFTDEDRACYTDVLAGTLRPAATCYLMCFSDRQPGDWGPRRVTQREIEDAFADGWTIERIEAAEFDINPTFGNTTVHAWLAEIRRSATS
jgi:SAM-dependent methyltransferase